MCGLTLYRDIIKAFRLWRYENKIIYTYITWTFPKQTRAVFFLSIHNIIKARVIHAHLSPIIRNAHAHIFFLSF